MADSLQNAILHKASKTGGMAMMNAIMKTSLMIIQTQPGDFRPPADHPKAKEVQAWHTPIGGEGPEIR